MRGERQSRSGPSSGPTAPRATSTEPLTGTSTLRAGVLYCTTFMASCIMHWSFGSWRTDWLAWYPTCGVWKPALCCCCRWGNAKSPAYGTLNDYQFMRRHTNSSKRQEKAKQCWGASLSKIDDVNKVFVKYAQGMPAPALFEQPGPILLLPKESSLRACELSQLFVYVEESCSVPGMVQCSLCICFLYLLWAFDRNLSTGFQSTSGCTKAARYIVLITRAWVLFLWMWVLLALHVIVCRGSWNVALE